MRKPQCARDRRRRNASRLDQPPQDRVGKRAGEMGNAFGPVVAKAQMRLVPRLEVDLFGSAPGKTLVRDEPGSVANADKLVAGQRIGKRDAKLACKMTVAGARLAQRFRQPRTFAIDLLRPGGKIDEGFDQ